MSSALLPASNRLKLPHRDYPYLWGNFAICALLLLPFFALVQLALTPDSDIWAHLWRTILPTQIVITLQLMIGVALLTALVGTSTAWLVTFCRFPCRKFFAWGLLLPLAMPTYLAAYSYSDLLDRAGPVFQLWQLVLPASAYPAFHSLGGGVFALAAVLFPYVFLAARAAFVQQSAGLIEAARALGLASSSCFWRVGLPLARPAIMAGVALTLMECLNDIGAVEHLGIQTLTIGVYDTWVVRGSLAGAAQMALALLAFVGVLIFIERRQRGNRRFAPRNSRARALPHFHLSPSKTGLAVLACLLPMALGFIVPVAHLIYLAIPYLEVSGRAGTSHLLAAMVNSTSLAALAVGATCLIGLFLAYGHRLQNYRRTHKIAGWLVQLPSHIAALGYAIPGTVLGLGILIALTQIDAATRGQVVLIGTIMALIFAYVVRFLPLAFGTLETGFGRMSPNMDVAARSLGARPLATLWRVHVPLLRAPLIAASLLVFVDVMKELPATLILRPFDFETLASMVYTRASLGQIEEAALPALMIIVVGLIPVIILLGGIDRARRKD